MLFPTLSVTLVGVIGALVALVARRHRPGAAFLLGIGGAWLGFLLGAVVGVTADVVLRSGIYVAIVGHLVAVAGTAVALARGGRLVKRA